jgi:hypothetical protein
MRIATGLEALIGLVLIAWTATFKLSYLFKKKITLRLWNKL